ncbi:hypothetical protein [Streptomyces sp. NPDC058579]|uniref:hypothetical protein n=1 Tax=Streptomyces sp. NPDC058579 TaxID=3346548 RepID=UPI0036535B5E
MPTTASTDRQTVALLGRLEPEVLAAVGCGLRDDEVAAIVHAFDYGVGLGR